MEQHYTLKETGERLHLSETTIRKYLKNGRLKGTKLGKVWRISESDVAEFLATNGGTTRNEVGETNGGQSDAGEAKGEG